MNHTLPYIQTQIIVGNSIPIQSILHFHKITIYCDSPGNIILQRSQMCLVSFRWGGAVSFERIEIIQRRPAASLDVRPH